MNEVLLLAALVWLLILTILMAGIITQLGAMQAAGPSRQAPDGGVLVDLDGPSIPSALPDRARRILEKNGIESNDLIVTFLSSGCKPCRERASDLVSEVVEPSHNVFLVTGRQDELVQEMRAILRPTLAPILGDPDAHDFVKALDVKSTPYIFRIVNRELVGKVYLRDRDDYRRIAESFSPTHSSQSSAAGSSITEAAETGVATAEFDVSERHGGEH